MKWIARADSIRRKLNLILFCTVGMALFLAAATLLAVQLRNEWRNAQRDLVTQADVMGLASEAALAFGDPRTGAQNLRVLTAQPSVVAAALYDSAGQLFAQFRAAGQTEAAVPARAPDTGVRFDFSHASVARRVMSNGEPIGTVYIQSRHGLPAEAAEYIGWLAAATLGSLFGALLLAHRLQRSLTDPILEVSAAAQHVLERGTFDVRATRRSNDEVGRLVDAFNAMLDELGARARVLQTANEALKDTESLLQQSNRAKDAFLATLAHELRNPLAPLRTGVQILRRPHVAEPIAQRTLETMDRQLTHMVRLIDDLLDISRINSGKIRIDMDRMSLRAALQTALELSRPSMDAAGHALSVDLGSDDVEVEGDATRLAQAFGNLLNNAARYTPAGGQIGLRLRREGREALVEVEDNGIGIPDDMLEQVFSLFTQVQSDSRQSAGGLGIGLFLVRSLVEMHGGTVLARSRGPALGSTFVVRLPCLLALPRPDAAAAKAGPDVPLARARVLVVDDNVDAAETLATFLEMIGMQVRTVHDGHAGLAAAREMAPDVVLLDIGLPGISGYEVAEALRAEARHSRMTLVALTGWGAEDDRRKAAAAGFHHHLTKPVDLQALETILRGLRAKHP
ncbi:MAG: hypothetical protein K0R89_1692 [Ramlibacter sp.]|jgi:signal transduction histidine kinase|nr:hypothetical protein [Ramlibacter sp.]